MKRIYISRQFSVLKLNINFCFTNLLLNLKFYVSPYSPQTKGFIEKQHKSINNALRALSDKTNWALHLPLITVALNNTFIEGSPYTRAQYALGTAQNLLGRVMFDKTESTWIVITPNMLETKVFLNMKAKIDRQFKRHNNKSYYEPGIFE